MDQHSPLTSFLGQAAAWYENHESLIAQHLSRTIVRASKGSIREPETKRIPCPINQDDLKLDGDPRLDAIVNIVDKLAWRISAAGRKNADLASKIAVAEIFGPDGIVWSDECRFGLLYQAPHVVYPSHYHEAEELYLVLRGTAIWQKDDSAPSKQKPGDFIRHKAWQPHGIETSADPLLALWGWAGNLAISTYAMIKPSNAQE